MHDALDFSGRRVLVVGGSSGIGAGIAQAFRAAGAEVTVWGTRASADAYAGVPGSDLTGLAYAQVDLAGPGAVDAAPAPFADGALDVLVLSQGVVAYGKKEFEAEGWRRVMTVNLDAAMDACRRFRPALAQAPGGGAIIPIASVNAWRFGKGNPAYSASKAALANLTRTLAQAWAADGIRVNGIAPGFVETKMTAVTTEHPARRAAMLSMIPMARFGTPQEMAGAALFLASPLSSYMTGQTLIVDGGITL
ncbi:MAG: SDR family oxidoreductase [Pseudomonadota bacterium]